jgi:hypothetical protein
LPSSGDCILCPAAAHRPFVKGIRLVFRGCFGKYADTHGGDRGAELLVKHEDRSRGLRTLTGDRVHHVRVMMNLTTGPSCGSRRSRSKAQTRYRCYDWLIAASAAQSRGANGLTRRSESVRVQSTCACRQSMLQPRPQESTCVAVRLSNHTPSCPFTNMNSATEIAPSVAESSPCAVRSAHLR